MLENITTRCFILLTPRLIPRAVDDFIAIFIAKRCHQHRPLLTNRGTLAVGALIGHCT